MTSEPDKPNLNVENTERSLSLQLDSRVQAALNRLQSREERFGGNPPMTALISAIEMILRMEEDRLRKQIAADFRNLYARIGRTSPTTVGASLFVIPDEPSRKEALDVLNDLRRATDALHDANDISSAYKLIIEELMFPALDDLLELLSREETSLDALTEARAKSVVTASGITETAKTVGILIQTAADADDAGANAVHGARKLTEAAFAFGRVIVTLIRQLNF